MVYDSYMSLSSFALLDVTVISAQHAMRACCESMHYKTLCHYVGLEAYSSWLVFMQCNDVRAEALCSLCMSDHVLVRRAFQLHVKATACCHVMCTLCCFGGSLTFHTAGSLCRLLQLPICCCCLAGTSIALFGVFAYSQVKRLQKPKAA